jgi:hypothetical protein
MDSIRSETIKQRDIAFCKLHPDKTPAQTAALVLNETPGIENLLVVGPHLLRLDYDLLQVTLQEIESLLVEVGFHLSGDLVYRIKRALFHYTEEIQRENLGASNKASNTRQVFIERYHRLNHACRDQRPEIWRHYR